MLTSTLFYVDKYRSLIAHSNSNFDEKPKKMRNVTFFVSFLFFETLYICIVVFFFVSCMYRNEEDNERLVCDVTERKNKSPMF
mmetsp:Transcript_22887/g.29303  ORF Transcript_22887/g.29303 Transcript_22887/m.29303 type:complete len:83 (-) Transcript_22887:2353-2601(-)